VRNNACPIVIECEGCGKEKETAAERCAFCEAAFCSSRCYKAHDCAGHDAEIVFCLWCDADIAVDNREHHETRPALIDGDPFCAKCVYEKPWDKAEVKREN